MNFLSTFTFSSRWIACFFWLLPLAGISQHFCGSDGSHQYHLLHNPNYYKAYKKSELDYQSYMKAKQASPKQAKLVGSLYIVPVVVHIVHDNGSENITDAQVINAINYMNDAFRYVTPYNGPNGVDTEIEFCLAKQNPSGNATTGINRVVSAASTELPYYDATEDLALKNLIRWNPQHYINIWVIRNIIGGTAGYAYMPPGGIGSNYDGIVLEYNYMGSSKSANNVLVHEMGHYLGLKHTFEGGCPNNNCLVDGDGICDTPPDASKFTCSGNSCITDPDDVAAVNPFRPVGFGGLGDQNDMSNNYMDYSSFSCQNAFSQGQKDRMRFFLHPTTGGRKLLHASLGCELPCSSPIVASYTYSSPVTSGISTTFTNTTTGATSYEWYINGSLVSTTTHLTHTFTTGGSYIIKLIAKNAEISCTQSDEKTINVVCPSMGASFNPSATTASVGATINFTNLTSTILDTTGMNNWYINSVLVSNTKDFSHLFSLKGTYLIKLVVGASSTSCTSSHTIPITITCPAQADFSITANDVPINTTVGFTSTGTNCPSHEWFINSTTMGTAPTLSHTFTTAGEYLAALVCDNGVCKDTAYRVINVYDPFSCGANKQANFWYFGAQAGLNFNSSPPTALVDGAMSTQEGVSTISSKNGNLLFYTNGVRVWDKTHTVMPNGTGLTGATTSTQSALIIPQPGNDSTFYIFTTDSLAEGGLRGLRYTKVNLNLNSGLGDVVVAEKNILMELNSNEQVTSIQHGNSCDIWIIAHRSNSSDYLAYHLSSAGINLTPVVSTSGSLNRNYFPFGYLKGSPDSKRLASAYGISGVELSDFDNFTGIVSNSAMILAQEQTTYGVEFSPNSNLLYVTSVGYNPALGGMARRITQYDVTLGSIAAITASAYLVVNETLGQQGGSSGALQLARDGKIYVAVPNATFLSTIELPNIPASGCLYTAGSTSLSGPGSTGFSRRGLPGIYPSGLQLADINFTCNAGPITFSYTGNISSPDTYFWDFGDPASGSANYSNDANPTHTFTGTGTYTIKLIVKKQCLCATVSRNITLPLSCILPIELLSFKGKRMQENAQLTWIHKDDQDIEKYELERRFESITEFEVVKVKGTKKGCSSFCEHTQYDNIPSHLSNENVFYRLKVTNKNGSVEYSDIIKLGPYTFGENTSRISMYPNPINQGQILTCFSPAERIEGMSISDINGRVVIQKNTLSAHELKENIDLSPGMYIVRISTESNVYYHRLVVAE